MKIETGPIYEKIEFNVDDVEKWAFNELSLEIKRLGIDYNTFAIGTPDAFSDGGWCISREDEYWLVYHSERGRRSGLSIFTSPFDAANFLLWTLATSSSIEQFPFGRLPKFKHDRFDPVNQQK